MNNRSALLQIFNAAINAVAPGEAVSKYLKIRDNNLVIDGRQYDLQNAKIRVVGAGKGAAPMAKALEQLLGDKISESIISVKYDHGLPLKNITVIEASHPVPDANGENAAKKIMDMLKQSRSDDLVIAIFTGGASALLPAPAADISLDDLQVLTASLLASGASIDEINTVRRHLSLIAGGKLAKAANNANVLALIVSDVIGDNLNDIASGPTAPDSSTYLDCLKIIEKYDLHEKLPVNIIQFIKKGVAGALPETLKDNDPVFQKVQNVIVASNSQALMAAKKEAEKLGYQVRVIEKPMCGEAGAQARSLINYAKEIASRFSVDPRPLCILAGGETTVSIKGNGKGGRNQEMALAAAIEIVDDPDISALFAGTDGTDGPTDAAGGFSFHDTVKKIGGMNEAKKYLENNDSYNALKTAEDILITGPTLTNVMDIAIILVSPEK